MTSSRRQFGRLLGGVTAATALSMPQSLLAHMATANSTWNGVRVGLNVPFSLGTRSGMDSEQVLSRCLSLGVGTVELRSQAIELSMGLPKDYAPGVSPGDETAVYDPGSALPYAPGLAPALANRVEMTAADVSSYRTKSKLLARWRTGVSLDAASKVRRAYRRAGVLIDVIKFDGIGEMDADEIDYCFRLTKALGARALSTELSLETVRRAAPMASRHKTFLSLHNHLAVTPAIFEEVFSYGPYVAANVDIGHYFAGNRASSLDFIRDNRRRITHVHIKDKTSQNLPVEFGKGVVPLKEVLQLIRDNRWTGLHAIIEYDGRPIPGIDRMDQLRQALDYCRSCLLS